ncbi:MAG: SDR family NAD(P)-dependent oxidoreductase [Microthrixaceae bacterium]
METEQTTADGGEFARRYGPWAVVAGASDGTGAAFATELAHRGVNVVLVARRRSLLEELAGQLDVQTRVIELDLSTDTAVDQLAAATPDLDIGLVVYNAGAEASPRPMVDQPLDELTALVRRNCTTVVGVCHHYGPPMLQRGAGGVLLVSSFAGWAGAATVATYAATKAFDTVLAEGLWAEWSPQGVDVLGLVLTATDTPALRRTLDELGGDLGALASPHDVAVAGLDHLGDGPTWSYGVADPTGPSPLGSLPRRDAVALMTQGARAMRS